MRAAAEGDFSLRLSRDGFEGELAELADAFDTLVERLRTVSSEVTRVAREVGTEGKLGGQAEVPGVSGTWKELADSVNQLAGNLTTQVRSIARVTTAVANGDLSQKIDVEARGEILELKDTINRMVEQLTSFASEVTRVAREVGTEGELGGQAKVPGVSGTWKDLTDSVNQLASNLTTQVRNIALVTKAVASGDLSQKITVDARGEILELKETINRMVDQLTSFAAEVTRVAHEVGTQGKLGGQAKVAGVAGTWKDLTDNVNQMAKNLTSQVRGIVRIVTAVAQGDLTQKLAVEANGEIAALAETLNDMTSTLRTFAEQVTTVAREVGVEGKLGGQAKVPGAAGTWKDLTENVNQLAGNLTAQVRAIAEVATAVATGDLSRTISVEAEGEVLALREHINKMIDKLRDTTRTNQEQDWLKTNLARLAALMQGERSLRSLCQLMISELTPLVSAQVGAFFVASGEGDDLVLKLLSSYAHKHRKTAATEFALGVGLVGQCALEKKVILVDEVPEGYLPIRSGLGEAPPRNLVVLPVLFEGQVKGVIELASFRAFSPIHLTLLEEIARNLGVVFNMIGASTRTEELLEELKKSNAELEQRTTELEEQATQLEQKNRQVAEASASLEEKARQLAMASRYKSEFLANMSHELRTPLNSLLVLGRMLAANEEGNLSPRQVEYARTIHSAGGELLALITQILDLSKIEAGKLQVERQRLGLEELRTYLLRNFEPIAEQKRLRFAIEIASGTPPEVVTDSRRLQQILKNLLSNALKFTEVGEVVLKIGPARDVTFRSRVLQQAPNVLAFSVVDTGIGIAEDQQQLIFEAFQQADSSTRRGHDGTGLGLTISRELARLLGGEIHLESRVGVGSRFTLYLPLNASEVAGVETIERARLEAPSEPPLMRSERPARSGEEAPREPQAAPPDAEPPPTAQAQPIEAESQPDETEAQPSETQQVAESPPESNEEDLEPPQEEGPLAGHSVLLVDEDARELFSVATELESYGLRVLPATSTDEALELLHQRSELELSLTSGEDATRAIRKEPRFENLPILALASEEEEQRARDAGCSEVVARPVKGERLREALERWLSAGKSA